MFFCLPDPDSLVIGMDPALDQDFLNFLCLKINVNVPFNSRKNCVIKLFFAGILKVKDENGRIRIS